MHPVFRKIPAIANWLYSSFYGHIQIHSSIVGGMMADAAKPWMLGSKTALAAAVRKLIKEGNNDTAAIAIIAEAAGGRFKNLASILAGLSDVREDGVQLLLTESATGSLAMEYVYASSGLPEPYYPLFATVVDFAREIAVLKEQAMGPKAQAFLVEKALTVPAVQRMNLPVSFTERLRKSFAPEQSETQPPGLLSAETEQTAVPAIPEPDTNSPPSEERPNS